jgi:hypothetical protein
VFGSIRAGVPNAKRDDDLSNYDVPVERITSPGDDGLTFLDSVVSKLTTPSVRDRPVTSARATAFGS